MREDEYCTYNHGGTVREDEYCTYNHFISCIDEYGSSTPHRPSSFNRSRSFSYSSSQLSMATSLPGMFVLARMCAHVNRLVPKLRYVIEYVMAQIKF